MTNLEMVHLYNVLSELRNSHANVAAGQPASPLPIKFALKLTYNLEQMQAQYDVVQAMLHGPWDEIINPFVAEEMPLILRHANLPPGVVPARDQLVQIADREAFEAERSALKEKHPGLDEALADRDAAYSVLTQETPSIALWKVTVDDVPNNLQLHFGQVEWLKPMIEGMTQAINRP